MTRRTGPQRAIRLQRFLFDPRARLISSAEVGDEPFESRTERIVVARLLLAFRLGISTPRCCLGAVEQHVAHLARKSTKWKREIDAEDFTERRECFPYELFVTFRPRRDRACL